MNLTQYLIEAGKAAVMAGVGYLAANYVSVDIAEPIKQIVAIAAVALWARFGWARSAA